MLRSGLRRPGFVRACASRYLYTCGKNGRIRRLGVARTRRFRPRGGAAPAAIVITVVTPTVTAPGCSLSWVTFSSPRCPAAHRFALLRGACGDAVRVVFGGAFSLTVDASVGDLVHGSSNTLLRSVLRPAASRQHSVTVLLRSVGAEGAHHDASRSPRRGVTLRSRCRRRRHPRRLNVQTRVHGVPPGEGTSWCRVRDMEHRS